jgi:hypothetical protein
VTFSDAIREAAGHGAPEAPAPERPEPVGDLGLGRGACAAGRPREPSASEQMSERIREAASYVRGRARLSDLYSGL